MTHRLALACAVLLSMSSAKTLADDEPALPAGLASPTTAPSDEPALPTGLGGDDDPGVPPGLAAEPPDAADAIAKPPAGKSPPFDVTGFWEIRGGYRTGRMDYGRPFHYRNSDPYEKAASLGETRLQLRLQKQFDKATLKLTGDLLYDAVESSQRVDLETGRGVFDLREASFAFTPLPFMDVKIGRQVLTWGTGDLIFLNDMFPKDYNSFFAGRNLEYLKAPSDALKASFFWPLANLDVVYTPRFDADRYIDGRRLSYYNSSLGRRAGRDAVIDADAPDEWFRDGEFASRLSRTVGSTELAAYGYWGRWKSPMGMDPATGRATFPRLNVYGASVRTPLKRGVGNAEFAYYDSVQDRGGDDPYKPNSQLRFLLGWETDLPEITRDLTLGLQYYQEWMMDYGRYRCSLPTGANADDERRHVVTFKLTKLLMNQNLSVSLFAFYSPNDCDAYLRPNVQYKIDDHWTVEAGANVMFGSKDYTFFAQFERDANVYVSLRYGF